MERAIFHNSELRTRTTKVALAFPGVLVMAGRRESRDSLQNDPIDDALSESVVRCGIEDKHTYKQQAARIYTSINLGKGNGQVDEEHTRPAKGKYLQNRNNLPPSILQCLRLRAKEIRRQKTMDMKRRILLKGPVI